MKTMDEYIKREAAIKAIEKADYTLIANDADSCKADYLREIIESVPAADVVPVVHGQWIYDKKAQRPYCSVCKGYFYGATNSPMSYCPNCGTKMDGGDSDEAD